MRPVPIVSEQEAATARVMEQKLLALPRTSGILFVGVKVQPGVGVPATFMVWVGCHRNIEEEAMQRLVEAALQEELSIGAIIKVEARRGVVRELKVVDKG